MEHTKPKQQGFTIVEMLIALAMFAILVPTLTIGVQSLTSLNNRARDLTLISIVAENKIETLRSIGYNSVQNGTIDFSSELPNEVASPKNASYTVSEESGLKTIDLVITYSDYGRPRTVLYKSLISETGIGQ